MEFTHTASNYNITSAQDTLNKNFTGAVDRAFGEFQQTKGSLLQAGNPKLTVRVPHQAHITQPLHAAAPLASVVAH